MSEYIDKAQAFKHFSEVAECYIDKANKEYNKNGCSRIWNDLYTRADEALKAKFYIKDLPSVYAAPSTHGTWLTIIDCIDPFGTKWEEYKCSICGRVENNKEPYCHCGAKMDG